MAELTYDLGITRAHRYARDGWCVHFRGGDVQHVLATTGYLTGGRQCWQVPDFEEHADAY